MFAVVVLTGTGLRIEGIDDWRNLAKLSGVANRTVAPVAAVQVDAGRSVVAHVVDAVVVVDGAVCARPARWTAALVEVIDTVDSLDTFATVLARIVLLRAVALSLAVLSVVAERALAPIRVDPIDTGAVVQASMIDALVHIRLTSDSLESYTRWEKVARKTTCQIPGKAYRADNGS